MNPYLWLSIGTGMVVLRSIIFGGSLGGMSYAIYRNVSKRFIPN
jgi:hypothetical protein